VSPGAVAGLAGNRNAPMAAYTAFIPPFGFDEAIGEYTGGQFWDGHVDTLEEQAKEPLLNPLEMHMADDVAVVEAVAASAYAPDFLAAFGPGSLDTTDAAAAFDRIAAVIGAYERTSEVNPFTSKHDYAMSLIGPERMETFTMQERQGMALFNRCCEVLGVPHHADGRHDGHGRRDGLPARSDDPVQRLPLLEPWHPQEPGQPVLHVAAGDQS